MSHQIRLIVAFAIVYFVWGSTFLAIKFAVQTMPPFLMMGVRFVIAGLVLLAIFGRGKALPTRSQWRHIFVLALSIIVFGTGIVAWTVRFIPSGMVGLICAVTPVWLVFFESLSPGGKLPGWRGLLGVFTGLFGLFLLINPESLGGTISWVPLAVLMFSGFSWSAGSIYSRHMKGGLPSMLGTAWQLLIGGLILVIAATVAGERIAVSSFSISSMLGLAYLVVFGSLLVFPAYMWLLKNTTPALLGTHAYVNPLVALTLGWLFVNEPITGRTILSAGIILSSVLIIGSDRSKASPSGRMQGFRRRLRLNRA